MSQTISLGRGRGTSVVTSNLCRASKALATNYERLSSGLRINRASDDAAGLAIADKLSSNGKIYGQAVRNVNDGISLLNIADSAISSLSAVLVTMNELAAQSANSTYTPEQRSALDREFQSLRSEYNRIVETTSFNKSSIFGGTDRYDVQAGYGSESVIPISLSVTQSATVGTGTLGAPTLYDAQHNATGLGGHDMVFADINNDNHLDIIAAEPDNELFFVQLGNGDGTFQTRTSFASDGDVLDIVVYDFNSDGNNDVLLSEQFGGSVQVHLGNGDGTFGGPVSYYAGLGARSGDVADLNGDGNGDVVISAQFGNAVAILFGNSDGSFDAPVSYDNIGRSEGVIFADVDNDGDQDIVSAQQDDGKINIFLNTGSGAFAAPVSYASGNAQTNGIDVGDFDNDGDIDIISAPHATGPAGTLNILLGNGDGTFNAAVSYGTTNTNDRIIAGDLNNDGALDAIVAGDSETVDVYLGNGDGTFQARTTYSIGQAVGLTLGDINEDGVLDFGATSLDGGTDPYLYVFLGETEIGSTTTRIDPLAAMDVNSIPAARATLNSLGVVQKDLGLIRGAVAGSFQRLSSADSLSSSFRSIFKSAESSIRDIDFASETAKMVVSQVLQQAGVGLLAQANRQSQIALTLLS